MPPYKASMIAEWFLRYDLVIRGQEGDGITNMKLQQLLYYAQSAHLALCDGEPLFDEPVLAGKHGPVVMSVYEKFNHRRSGFLWPDNEQDLRCIIEQDRYILVSVYDRFGQYDARKLRDMTHAEDPWKHTERNEEIPREAMRMYFDQHYVGNY